MKEKMRKVTVPPTPPETRIITRAIIRLCMNASFGRDAPEDTGLYSRMHPTLKLYTSSEETVNCKNFSKITM